MGASPAPQVRRLMWGFCWTLPWNVCSKACFPWRPGFPMWVSCKASGLTQRRCSLSVQAMAVGAAESSLEEELALYTSNAMIWHIQGLAFCDLTTFAE